MSSFWRINVSQNGQFYFRVDNEFINRDAVKTMVREFRQRFPASEGFSVTLMNWDCSGIDVEVS